MPDPRYESSRITSDRRRNRLDLSGLGMSLILGVMIWAYVDLRRTDERGLDIPLSIPVPSGWERSGEPLPAKIHVTVRGPRLSVAALQVGQILVAPRVVPSGQEGDRMIRTLTLTREDVQGLPNDVTVIEIQPSIVTLTLVRVVRRHIPIKVMLTGEPEEGYTVGEVTHEPSTVIVTAPEEQFSPENVVSTFPISLTGRREYFTQTVGLQRLHLKDRIIDLPESVYVTVAIVEQKVTRTLENVPVRLLLATWTPDLPTPVLTPAQVRVTVRGRSDRIKTLAGESVLVFVDTRDLGPSLHGERILPCKSRAPEGIDVIAIEPSEVVWKVVPLPERSSLSARGEEGLGNDRKEGNRKEGERKESESKENGKESGRGGGVP